MSTNFYSLAISASYGGGRDHAAGSGSSTRRAGLGGRAPVAGADVDLGLPDSRCLDLRGHRRGKLEVIGVARIHRPTPGSDMVTYWKVRCDCGTAFELATRPARKREGCDQCEHVAKFLQKLKLRPEQQFTVTGLNQIRKPPGKQMRYMWSCVCACEAVFVVESKHIHRVRSCPKCSLLRVGQRLRGRKSPRRKDIATPHVKKLLREAYAFTGTPAEKLKKKLTLKAIAKKTACTTSALRELAVSMGLSNTKGRILREWSGDELALLTSRRDASIQHIRHTLTKHGFTRSRIEIRDKRIELEYLEHEPVYSSEETARLIGCRDVRELLALVRATQLNPLEVTWSDKELPTFNRDELKRFLRTHPDSYQLANVDRVFFNLLVVSDRFEDPDQGDSTVEALTEASTPAPAFLFPGRLSRNSTAYNKWTREEVVEALRYLHRVYQVAPSVSTHYQCLVEVELQLGSPRRIPSSEVLRRFWETVGDAWREVGVTPTLDFKCLQLPFKFTAQVDLRIMAIYARNRKRNERLTALGRVAGASNIPASALALRAVQLGCHETRNRAWAGMELEILNQFAHRSRQSIVQALADAGYDRTMRSGRIIQARRDVLTSSAPSHYSVQQLGYRIGLDPKSVKMWLDKGWVGYEMKGTARTKQQGGDTRLVSAVAVATLLRAHPELLDFRKVDHKWLLALLGTDKR